MKKCNDDWDLLYARWRQLLTKWLWKYGAEYGIVDDVPAEYEDAQRFYRTVLESYLHAKK